MSTATMRAKLCVICGHCGSLYFWCEHLGGAPTRVAPFEEARAVAAKLLLSLRFDDAPPFTIDMPAKIIRDIHEVFGASEEVT